MFHYASEMLLWLALICSWGWVDGWAAAKFLNVRFRGARRLGLMTRVGAKQTPSKFPGTACSPSGSGLGGNFLFAQFRCHIASAFPGQTTFGEIQPCVKQ